MKRLEPISMEEIITAFDRPDLRVFTDSSTLESFLKSQINGQPMVYLMMSSGTFGGADLTQLEM